MEQMHEIVLSKNRLRDGAMVGRAMRAVKTLKKLDLSENDMADLRQGWRPLYSAVVNLNFTPLTWTLLGPKTRRRPLYFLSRKAFVRVV